MSGALLGGMIPGASSAAQADDDLRSIYPGTTAWGEVDADDPEGHGGHYEPVTFEGEGWQRVAIELWGGGRHKLLLIGPDGELLAEGAPPEEDGQGEPSKEIPGVALEQSGVHTIVVAAADPENTSAYQLELHATERVEEPNDGDDSGDADDPEQPSEPERPDAPFAARVVGPRGEPVDGGTVRVHGAESTAELTTAEIDSSGWVTLTEDDLTAIDDAGTVDVLVSAGDWFDGYTFEAGTVRENDGEDLPLRRELLYGPTVAEAETRRLGAVSVWRHVGFPDPATQAIVVEVTNTRADGTASEIVSDAYDLTSGSFSLSYPEDEVAISHGTYTDLQHPRERHVASVDTPAESPHPAAAYHPTRTGLPLGGTSLVSYSELTTTEQEEVVNEGVGRILSTLPYTGTLLQAGDLMHWTIGDPAAQSATLGIADPEPINPNAWDTSTQPWKSDDGVWQEASVIGVFPIRLETDGPTTIDVRAEWMLESWLLGVGTGSGSFAQRFEIGPV